MNNLTTIFVNFMLYIRTIGVIAITGCVLVVFGVETVRSKLSPAKMIGVAATGIFAVMLFWMLPTLVNFARGDANGIVPNQPIGTYR